jgi:predicted nucleic acid-binding protein
MIVVADTSPINYLVLIGHVEILALIYQQVLVPRAVFEELNAADAPAQVRAWLAQKPRWLEVRSHEPTPDTSLDYLGRGERAAIALAQSVKADRLIVDDGDARREATRRGVPIIGLLGVLLEASRRGLLDLSETIEKLRQTTFYVSDELILRLLEVDRHRSS